MSYRLISPGILRDVKLGVRTLGKHPIVTVIAIVTLTLGIGVSAGIFALVNAFWLTTSCGEKSREFCSTLCV